MRKPYFILLRNKSNNNNNNDNNNDNNNNKFLEAYITTWIYNIRRNVNSDFSIVTMRRVAIIFFELGVVKNFMQKF